MNRKLSSYLLSFILFAPLCLTGCGNTTTLARIGAVAVGFVQGYKTELNSLLLANLITQETFNKRDKEADQAVRTARALQNYLGSLTGVNSANKAQVVAKIAEAVSLIRATIVSATGVPQDSTAIRILNYAVTALQTAAATIEALSTPAPRGVTASADPGRAPASIKVTLPAPPPDVEKYLKK